MALRSWAVDVINGTNTLYAPSNTTTVPSVYSKANPCQVTSSNHGLITGDYIYITGVTGTGWTSPLNTFHFVTVIDANNFTIPANTSGATGATPTGLGTWIPAIQRTNPCQITCKAHGFNAGQIIWIGSVTGMTQLNNAAYKVGSVINANNYTITDLAGTDINATGYTAYSSNGTFTTYSRNITSITQANPAVVTSSSHGFSNGDKVYISCDGMTEIDKFIVTVANATTDTFECSGVDSSAFSAFTEGTVRRPYQFMETLRQIPSTILEYGSYVYHAQTWKDDSSVDVGSGNITFTDGLNTVSTSVSLVGTVAVGDFIGKTSAVGTGWDGISTRPETFRRVTAITATTITMAAMYSGTTEVVSSISRLRQGTEIRDHGTTSNHGVNWTRDGIIIEGGYDFSGGRIVRNGETWLSPVTKNASFASFAFYGASTVPVLDVTVRYFGFVNGQLSVYWYNPGSISFGNSYLENCFLCGSTSPHYDSNTGGTSTNQVCETRNCVFVPYALSTQTLCRFLSYMTIKDCYATGHVSYTTGFTSPNGYTIHDNCVADRCLTGIVFAGNGVLAKNCKMYNCNAGYQQGSNLHGSLVLNSTATSCNIGVYISSACQDFTVQGCTFTACSYGFLVNHNDFVRFTFNNNTCVSCTRDIYSNATNANSFIYINKHSSTTPSVWSIDISSGLRAIISEFIIDAPSIAKAIANINSSYAYGFSEPAYTFTNSPQFNDGAYYYYHSYTKDPSVYRTSGKSMKLQTNFSINFFTGFYQHIEETCFIPVYKTYAKAGVARTVTFYMKRHASWAGSIRPSFRLNGLVVDTETEITSIDDTNWQQFIMTCPAGAITVDGVLSLDFNINGSNSPFWLDDFTVT